jgi:hypothetical protein
MFIVGSNDFALYFYSIEPFFEKLKLEGTERMDLVKIEEIPLMLDLIGYHSESIYCSSISSNSELIVTGSLSGIIKILINPLKLENQEGLLF